MKRIVCGIFGTIYDASILKDGKMSLSGRRECTDECINAVCEHLFGLEGYQKYKNSGYEWDKKDGNGHITLRLYDDTEYELVKKKKD